MHVDTTVDQVAKVRPVLEVARAPVDLVNDNALRVTLLQFGKHAREQCSTLLRGRFLLLEPLSDLQALPGSIRLNGASLFLKGRAVFALPHCRDADVRKISSHISR